MAATHITVCEHESGGHGGSGCKGGGHEGGEHGSHGHGGGHRHWKDIRKLIGNAAAGGIVSAQAADTALRAFTRVAEAEARVHGVQADQVHFHEVGAADSIIDILFNSLLLDLLSPTAVYATPLALGQGTLICAHGELPVPAPATAEILAQGKLPVYASCHDGELTTPTGAALIAEFVSRFAPLPCSQLLATGYGAGSREIAGAANVLRALAGNPAPLAGLKARQEGQANSEAQQEGQAGSKAGAEDTAVFIEGVTQLETNIDHLSAEALAFVCEKLLDSGVLDVWQESIVMKKGRLATKLLVLAPPEQATACAQQVIELTGSLGVRSSYLERACVAREILTLDTAYGPVPFKVASLGSGGTGRAVWLRPEHDAVAHLAREYNLNYPSLSAELQALGKQHHDETQAHQGETETYHDKAQARHDKTQARQ
jgi:uncharacterized protein (TIGR00299 family) protein